MLILCDSCIVIPFVDRMIILEHSKGMMTLKMTITVEGEIGGEIVKTIIITIERDQRRMLSHQLIISL